MFFSPSIVLKQLAVSIIRFVESKNMQKEVTLLVQMYVPTKRLISRDISFVNTLDCERFMIVQSDFKTWVL